MKRLIAATAAALLIGGGLTACTDDTASNPDYARICVDAKTHERVAGDECGSNDGSALEGFLWGYVLFGSRMPAYGAPVTNVNHVTYNVPKSAVVEHDEKLQPQGGKSYVNSTAKRSYTTGSGTKLGTYKGTSGFKSSGGYKAPAPKAPAGGGYKAPGGSTGGGFKAPAPAYRAPAPAFRAPAVRSFR